jgi:hypothetical protein
MSVVTPSRSGRPLIDRLPADKRDQLIGVGREALRRYGYSYQQVFDDHLEIFTFLAAQGATATMIGQMLGEVGIVRADGSALPAGTVSSALSRARERAPQRRGVPLHVPAQPGTPMQVAACTGTDLQSHAAPSNDARSSTAAPRPTVPPMPGRPQSFPQIRPSPNAPAGRQMPATTRRAAALLEELRSKDDER